ncbi:MAG: hypothetical protein PHN82_11755 [bacterium]|nr:hypothetical protein [bacterium]
MKNVPCVMACLAALALAAAVLAKLAGWETVLGSAPRGLLSLAMVLLLFGINHSLCRQCMEK